MHLPITKGKAHVLLPATQFGDLADTTVFEFTAENVDRFLMVVATSETGTAKVLGLTMFGGTGDHDHVLLRPHVSRFDSSNAEQSTLALSAADFTVQPVTGSLFTAARVFGGLPIMRLRMVKTNAWTATATLAIWIIAF